MNNCNRNDLAGIAIGWCGMVDGSEFEFPQKYSFLISTYRPTLEASQPPTHDVARVLSPEVNRMEPEASHYIQCRG
jgi:hypothetical protein